MTMAPTREERGLSRLDQHVEHKPLRCGWCDEDIPEHHQPVDRYGEHFCSEMHALEYAGQELHYCREDLERLAREIRRYRDYSERNSKLGMADVHWDLLNSQARWICQSRGIDLSESIKGGSR